MAKVNVTHGSASARSRCSPPGELGDPGEKWLTILAMAPGRRRPVALDRSRP